MNQNVWCKHYQAMFPHKVCKVGVAYSDVRVSHAGETGPRYPCFQRDGVASHCSQVAYPSAEEQAEDEREDQAIVARFVVELDNDICPHCHQPIARYIQVGRSVYAEPCNHRLYQGTVPHKE